MRSIFNIKVGIATVAAAFMAAAGAYIGLADKGWTPEAIRTHLKQSTDVPAIKDTQARAEFALDVMFIGMQDDELKDEAMALLLKLKDDPEARVRASAAQGIVRVGFSYPGLSLDEKVAILEGMIAKHPDDTGLRAGIAYWYGSMGEDSQDAAAEIMPVLLPLLRDEDASVRVSATRAVGTVGARVPSQAAPALDAVLAMANDESAQVRAAVASLMTWITGRNDLQKDGDILSALITLSGDGDEAVRREAVLSLSAFHFRAPTQAEAIHNALQARIADPSEEVRVFVAGRMADIARLHPAYIDRALDAATILKGDSSDRVRYMTADALGDLAAVAPAKAIPLLAAIAARTQESFEIRHEAVMGIGIVPQRQPEQAAFVVATLREIEKSVAPGDTTYLRQSIRDWIDTAADYGARTTAPQAPATPRP